MAGYDNLLTRISALIAGFDDASWEALASRGLLRRARKDIEKGLHIQITGEVTGGLQIEVPPAVVTMPESGPARAACTCPAPGICQHILIAGLYVQTLAAGLARLKPLASAESIRAEIASLTGEQLRAWAGSVDYRAGVSLAGKNASKPIIEYGEAVVVALMPSGIEGRFLPGRGLDGMILPKAQGKRAAVAVVLALRASLGLDTPELAVQQSLLDLSGTPRSQSEILASAAAVLKDAVAVGLSHVSSAAVDRLVTLSVSAQGASLPRVSLALKTVADEIDSILERRARADEGCLLLVMARVYALTEAIRHYGNQPPGALAGTARADYVDVPEIELCGLGAYTWTTGSGYSGLTLLFWSSPTGEFLSWSEARPVTQQFDPRARWKADGPWEGAQSPSQVASSVLKLRNARRTASGRISGSTKTSALVLGPVAPAALEFGDRLFTSWDALRKYVFDRQPLGLRDSNPLELIAVLEPAAFGLKAFDPISQNFSWEVYDDEGRPLVLSLPFQDWSKDAIRRLEELRPPLQSRWRLLARLAFRDGAVSAEPVSFLGAESPDHPIFHLAFDILPQIPERPHSTAATEAGDETKAAGLNEPEEIQNEDGEAEETEEAIPATTYLYGIITELNRRLQLIAEAGCQNGLEAHRAWLEKLQGEVHAAGLTGLAIVLAAMRDPGQPAPSLVLKARYLTLLHSQAMGHLN